MKPRLAPWRHDEIVLYSSSLRKQYFFTTDHCQRVCEGGEIIPKDFVAITTRIPHYVVPRPSLPDGWVTNLKDMLLIYHNGETEIPNPDPKFQPDVEGY